MARNQQDPNDRLEADGFDYVVVKNSTFETVDNATLDLIGDIRINGIPLGLLAGFGFVHVQGSPSDTWTINHNLGYKPIAQVFNAGSIAVLTEIENVNVNQTVVRIAPATTGFVRLV